LTGKPYLTARQTEVIELLMQGLIDKEIAERLGIGLRTVKELKIQARERFGARTSCELVAKYLRQQLSER
jgi:two-component system response regulator DctR